jgi:hypothetical protein
VKRSAVVVAAGLLALSAATSSCVGVQRAATPAPQLFVNEEAVIEEKGTACGVDVDVQTGRLPTGAVVLARYHLTTSQPVPLQQVLDLLKSYGRRRCAHGVRVLRADLVDGEGGVIAAEAAAYALPSS